MCRKSAYADPAMRKHEPGPRALKRWRKAQQPRVSQKQVGEWVGVGASRISHYETCLEDLPIQHKVMIAKRAGIPLPILLTREQRNVVSEAVSMIGEAA